MITSICEIGFNPYFTGSNSGSLELLISSLPNFGVSILILLEVILEETSACQVLFDTVVSILILLEVILEGVH